MSVNKATLIGRLGKDPEVSYTQSGTARCRFSLATSEQFNDSQGQRQEKTEWHNIVVWGKLAENVGKHMSKGRQVYLEGPIQTRSWDDEQSGQKRYMTEINAKKVVYLDSRNDGGQQGGYQGGQQGGYQGGQRTQQTQQGGQRTQQTQQGGQGRQQGHGGNQGRQQGAQGTLPNQGGGYQGGQGGGGNYGPEDDDIPF